MTALERAPAWSLALVSMMSVQIGAAVSVRLLPAIGVAGTAWLRLSIGAIVFVAWARPHLSFWTWGELRMPAALGLCSAVLTLGFLAAVEHLPLGTTVALSFLGPLCVAALHAHSRRALVWPALALVGVLVLTEPWAGPVSGRGVLFALASAAGWGAYILITQHIGDRFSGVDGLALSAPVAALVTAVVGIPQAWGGFDLEVLLIGILVAVLMPVIPYAFELYALRRMTAAAFGTLMALEPAIGTLVGAVMLGQVPSPLQGVGMACVVIAGIGAERQGHRGEPARFEPLG